MRFEVVIADCAEPREPEHFVSEEFRIEVSIEARNVRAFQESVWIKIVTED